MGGHGSVILCLLLLNAAGHAYGLDFKHEFSSDISSVFHISRHTRNANLAVPYSGRLTVKDNHKPVINCAKINPAIEEDSKQRSFVVQVQATDEDTTDKLTYKFVQREGERKQFNIDEETGVITTDFNFDRDEPFRMKEVYVTVLATDNGWPNLADVCTFKITILDVNDNPPIFDKDSYTESIPQDLLVGREVMRISATDIDDGENSRLTYGLGENEDSKYLMIDESNGIITLKKPITDKKVGDVLTVMALCQDHGTPQNGATPAELKIKIVDSTKKAPAFVKIPTDSIRLAENFRDYEGNITNVTATSNMDNNELQFVLETGRTEQTNKKNTFVLVSEGDTAYIKLGRDLDYESITEYTLTIRVLNKDSLSAVTKINIKVTDVNDNIPAFMELISGSVLENEPPGTPVMQVQAVDMDATSPNNRVYYELADHQDLFQIDPDTGNITTKVELDREYNSGYNVKVIASDGAKSALNTKTPNKAEQVFRIVVEDKNDNRPEFTKSVYIANDILESIDTNKLVIEVKAEDKDNASVIIYSITDGNIGDAFYIERTGKVKVKNKLDYETIKKYELKVLADDGKYNDTAEIIINITNVNDMLPEFKNFQWNVTVKEETMVEGCLVQVNAIDPDKQPDEDQEIVYSAAAVKGDSFLAVDGNGCITLTKKLDRDPPFGNADWQAIITAKDENGAGNSQSKDFFIHLIDINDNAPFLNITEVVWPENEPVTHKPITVLEAEDYDDISNGPPFKYELARSASEEIRRNFVIRGDKLYPLKIFDREEKKEYIVPVSITDSGTPTTQTGRSDLKVIIGDVNDNPMKPGSSKIFVNTRLKNMPNTKIGRVYVDDPDDWDLPYKQFSWKGEVSEFFTVNKNTGDITILSGVKEGTYHLEIIVSEQAPAGSGFSDHKVSANVTVIVKEIPDQAIIKSGSIRMIGKSAEEFVTVTTTDGVSEKDKLQKELASLMNVSLSNLDIVSVLHSNVHGNKSLLDVRYSAHGSPYRWPEELNTKAVLNQEKLDIAESVFMVNIAECMNESVCPDLSCTNYLNISDIPYVVNTNLTSYVGVSAIVQPVCSCSVIDKKNITPKCLNDVTLIEDGQCQCPEGLDGPHCESLSISFMGDGWAMYPSFDTCNYSELTLELTTSEENGLIFYIGPLRNNPKYPVKDFMSLELKNGFPLLLVDYGSGTVPIEQRHKKINDGTKHYIYINFQPNSIEMKVDKCQSSNCLKLAAADGPNKALNVNGPLQVGGSIVNLQSVGRSMGWNHTPTNVGFVGCIRNLTYNGQIYNLGRPSYSEHAYEHCNVIPGKAAAFGIDSNFLVALLVCLAILLILLLAVVVHRRKHDPWNEKELDDIRETIINYEDEGGGEVDTGFDLDVLRRENNFDEPHIKKDSDTYYGRAPEEVPDISGFLKGKKDVCDKDPDFNPFDDVRYYAYEGDGNTSRSSLSSLASCTDEGDLKFNYLSNFGPRFRKLADMYGEEPSDDDDNDGGEESWC